MSECASELMHVRFRVETGAAASPRKGTVLRLLRSLGVLFRLPVAPTGGGGGTSSHLGACLPRGLGEQERCGGGGACKVGGSKGRPLAVDGESEDPGLWLEGLGGGQPGEPLGIPRTGSAPSSHLPGVSGPVCRMSTGVSGCNM